MKRYADISFCGNFRFTLGRIWDASFPIVVWVMLNPSTADAEVDDATIRKCMAFARRWGYGGIHVVNVFPYRATDPKALRRARAEDIPITTLADNYYYERAIQVAFPFSGRKPQGLVVFAWGNHAIQTNKARTEVVAHNLTMASPANCQPKRLGTLTKQGAPRHPLYLALDTPLVEYGS